MNKYFTLALFLAAIRLFSQETFLPNYMTQQEKQFLMYWFSGKWNFALFKNGVKLTSITIV